MKKLTKKETIGKLIDKLWKVQGFIIKEVPKGHSTHLKQLEEDLDPELFSAYWKIQQICDNLSVTYNNTPIDQMLKQTKVY